MAAVLPLMSGCCAASEIPRRLLRCGPLRRQPLLQRRAMARRGSKSTLSVGWVVIVDILVAGTTIQVFLLAAGSNWERSTRLYTPSDIKTHAHTTPPSRAANRWVAEGKSGKSAAKMPFTREHCGGVRLVQQARYGRSRESNQSGVV